MYFQSRFNTFKKAIVFSSFSCSFCEMQFLSDRKSFFRIILAKNGFYNNVNNRCAHLYPLKLSHKSYKYVFIMLKIIYLSTHWFLILKGF